MKKIIAVYTTQSYTDSTGTVYPAGSLYQLNSYPNDAAYAKELSGWASLPLATAELGTMPDLAILQWDSATKGFIAKTPAAVSTAEQTFQTLRTKPSVAWTLTDIAEWLKAMKS